MNRQEASKIVRTYHEHIMTGMHDNVVEELMKLPLVEGSVPDEPDVEITVAIDQPSIALLLGLIEATKPMLVDIPEDLTGTILSSCIQAGCNRVAKEIIIAAIKGGM